MDDKRTVVGVHDFDWLYAQIHDDEIKETIVECKMLDDLAQVKDAKTIDLLKVDVEGGRTRSN